MSRSMGDLVAKSVGVTYEPEIKFINNLSKADKFIVIGSDGLWDRIPNDEVTRIIANNYYDKRDADGAASFLMTESVARWQKD
jgi:serine/threonine protein phosphatase PrpC